MSFYLSNRRTFVISAVLFFSFFCFIKIEAQVWQNYKKDGVNINYLEADKGEIAKIAAYLKNGSRTIKKFFGKKFPKSFEVYLFPDRKSLTEAWRKDWNAPDFESQCWMVASGTASKLMLLSPRTWRTEACEHNPDDSNDTQFVITHEMVHVFHGQNNPNPNFDGMDDVGWFVEGLATYASGQLAGAKLAGAREAIEKGKEPKELENAWSGKYRYGVSGSIVKYIDTRFGRKILFKMLRGTNEKELLGMLNLSEGDLLSAWKDFVLKPRA
jgi:hypothetical protein